MLAFASYFSTIPFSAHATEAPVGPPNGADAFLAGALPPPGTYGVLFLDQYNANQFNDGNRNSVVPNFNANVSVVALKVLHMTGSTVGGGQLGFYGALPLINQSLSAAGASDSRSGIGDVEMGPVLGWHEGDLHWYALATLVTPTGAYDKGRMVNLSSNYVTFRPQFAISYLSKSGLDLSARLNYSFNSKNQATDFQSGQYFGVDYNIGFAINESLKIGLQGYYLHQTTDDQQGGVKVGPNGNRANVMAYGPGIFYQGKSASIEVKYLTETEVENRPQGNLLQLKTVWRF